VTIDPETAISLAEFDAQDEDAAKDVTENEQVKFNIDHLEQESVTQQRQEMDDFFKIFSIFSIC